MHQILLSLYDKGYYAFIIIVVWEKCKAVKRNGIKSYFGW
jgi:hypothetical protein